MNQTVTTTIFAMCLIIALTIALLVVIQRYERMWKTKQRILKGNNSANTAGKNAMQSIEFSKKMVLLFTAISVLLCLTTIIGSFAGFDMTAVGALAGVSFVADGTWGGFYLWKSKNENRAKYAQQFVIDFADKYGVDAAIQIAALVLKD